MKRITLTMVALFALSTVFAACHDTEHANEKIQECLEEEYGEDEADNYYPQYELTCEDGEDACDECVDCVLDAECTDLLDGECSDTCE